MSGLTHSRSLCSQKPLWGLWIHGSKPAVTIERCTARHGKTWLRFKDVRLRVCLPSDNGPGREIVYPGALYPNSAEYVSYDETDFLQVEGDIVLACPADLKNNSAALRYVLQECGIENVFSLRPKVGEMLTIPPDGNPNPNQSVHLLIVRANQRAPLLTDDYLRCMTHLIQRLMDKGAVRVHLPILDPERPTFSLVNLYHALANMFEGTGIHVVLHSRVYVSILSIGLE